MEELIKAFVENAVKSDKCEKLTVRNVVYTVGYFKACKDLCVWADDGMTSLFTVGAIMPEMYIDDIVSVIMNHINGYIYCSDCGKKIRRADIAGQYFAGVYCKDCWEGKWKEIEARETYD